MSDNMYNRKLTGFIIHGFACAHAAAAALLAQTIIGDEFVLTTLTVSMIVSIARINGKSWGIGDALSVVGTLAGWYLGTRGAMFLIKWIPGLGNGANAITTFGVTELLGWTAYLLVKENKKPEDLSDSEKANLKSRAKKLKESESEESKRLYEKMNYQDKNEFDNIMKQLKHKNLPEDTINYLTSRLEEIAKKYI